MDYTQLNSTARNFLEQCCPDKWYSMNEEEREEFVQELWEAINATAAAMDKTLPGDLGPWERFQESERHRKTAEEIVLNDLLYSEKEQSRWADTEEWLEGLLMDIPTGLDRKRWAEQFVNNMWNWSWDEQNQQIIWSRSAGTPLWTDEEWTELIDSDDFQYMDWMAPMEYPPKPNSWNAPDERTIQNQMAFYEKSIKPKVPEGTEESEILKSVFQCSDLPIEQQIERFDRLAGVDSSLSLADKELCLAYKWFEAQMDGETMEDFLERLTEEQVTEISGYAVRIENIFHWMEEDGPRITVQTPGGLWYSMREGSEAMEKMAEYCKEFRQRSYRA